MSNKKYTLALMSGLVLPVMMGCTETTPQPAQTAPAPLPAPNIPQPQPGQPDPEATQRPTAPQIVTANVRYLQNVFNNMDAQQRANIQNNWLSVKGDDRLESVFLSKFVSDINERGTVENNTGQPLTEREAQQFMDWTLLQQA